MWKPKVLTEFEIGRAMSAIADIGLRNKPIAHVGTRRCVTKAGLVHDLKACIRDAPRGGGRVFSWIRKGERENLHYGFYAHKCMCDALDHMWDSNIDPRLRHVFLGLVFGYSPSSIDRFLRRVARLDGAKKNK